MFRLFCSPMWSVPCATKWWKSAIWTTTWRGTKVIGRYPATSVVKPSRQSEPGTGTRRFIHKTSSTLAGSVEKHSSKSQTFRLTRGSILGRGHSLASTVAMALCNTPEETFTKWIALLRRKVRFLSLLKKQKGCSVLNLHCCFQAPPPKIATCLPWPLHPMLNKHYHMHQSLTNRHSISIFNPFQI